MKKSWLVIAAVALLGLVIAGMASAGPGGKRGGGYAGCGPGYGMECGCFGGPACVGRDGKPADPKKRNAFLKESEPLRREMAAAQGEFQAMMRQASPDPKAAGELSARMFDLRNKIHDKARASGVDCSCGMGAGCGGMGPGRGNGPGCGKKGPGCRTDRS